MKQYLLFVFIILTLHTHAQEYNQFQKANNYSIAPNEYNDFINNNNISWGGYFYTKYTFPDSLIHQQSLYDYLIQKQTLGSIKLYIPKTWAYSKWSGKIKTNTDDFYLETSPFLISDTNSITKDSLKEIGFEQILYIQEHQLKSYIIGAGPDYSLYTSMHYYVGAVYARLSSLNKKRSTKTSTDRIVFIGNTYKLYSPDSTSFSQIDNIKATYGMNFITNLWYDLSKGYNKLIDLQTSTIIAPTKVWDYTTKDSVEDYNVGDTLGPILISLKPALNYLSTIGIKQEWYYNITKNIFFNDIKEVDLYMTYPNRETSRTETKKRFKIIFN